MTRSGKDTDRAREQQLNLVAVSPLRGSVVYYVTAVAFACLFMTSLVLLTGILQSKEGVLAGLQQGVASFVGIYVVSLLSGGLTVITFALLLRRLALRLLSGRNPFLQWTLLGGVLAPAVFWGMSGVVYLAAALGHMLPRWVEAFVWGPVWMFFTGPIGVTYMVSDMGIDKMTLTGIVALDGAATALVLASVRRRLPA